MTLGPEHWCRLVGDVEILGPVGGGRHGGLSGRVSRTSRYLGTWRRNIVAGHGFDVHTRSQLWYTRDGRWSAERSQVLPFRIRIVVRASSRVEQRVHGARAAIGAGTALQALAGHTETEAAHRKGLLERMKTRNRD